MELTKYKELLDLRLHVDNLTHSISVTRISLPGVEIADNHRKLLLDALNYVSIEMYNARKAAMLKAIDDNLLAKAKKLAPVFDHIKATLEGGQ